jgi:hypothetical protein
VRLRRYSSRSLQFSTRAYAHFSFIYRVTHELPFEQLCLKYPNGTAYAGVLDLTWGGETFLQQVYDYRLADNSALLDAMPRIANDTVILVNVTYFVFFGYSVGGTTALNAILVDYDRTGSEEKTFLA